MEEKEKENILIKDKVHKLEKCNIVSQKQPSFQGQELESNLVLNVQLSLNSGFCQIITAGCPWT